jgi:hypothetical protein
MPRAAGPAERRSRTDGLVGGAARAVVAGREQQRRRGDEDWAEELEPAELAAGPAEAIRVHADRYARRPPTGSPARRIHEAYAGPAGHNRDVNLAARILLLLWAFGYLFVSCAPILGGHLILGALSLAGGILFFPFWVIGIVVLAGIIWLTNPPG